MNFPAGSSHKVANAASISGGFETWDFGSITGKADSDSLETDDLLLVEAEDGTLRGYDITLGGNSLSISASEGSLQIVYEEIMINGQQVNYEDLGSYQIDYAQSTVTVNDGINDNIVSLSSLAGIIASDGTITSNVSDLAANFNGVDPTNFDGTESITVNITDAENTFNLSDTVGFPADVVLAIAKAEFDALGPAPIWTTNPGNNILTEFNNYIGSVVNGVTVTLSSVTHSDVVNISGEVVGSSGEATQVTLDLDYENDAGVGTTETIDVSINVI